MNEPAARPKLNATLRLADAMSVVDGATCMIRCWIPAISELNDIPATASSGIVNILLAPTA